MCRIQVKYVQNTGKIKVDIKVMIQAIMVLDIYMEIEIERRPLINICINTDKKQVEVQVQIWVEIQVEIWVEESKFKYKFLHIKGKLCILSNH